MNWLILAINWLIFVINWLILAIAINDFNCENSKFKLPVLLLASFNHNTQNWPVLIAIFNS